MNISVNDITEKIIGAAYKVGNTLGIGFLEKVYEKALLHELIKDDIEVQSQYPLKVIYDGVVVGQYFADLYVEKSVIVELKCAKSIDNTHIAQCLNYLKATNCKIGLIVNFGTKQVQVKRIINGF